MRKITKEKLNTILENHEHYLNRDCENWQNMKANLKNTDLSYFDLSLANLECADLRYADLSFSNLRTAKLRNADLRYANLYNANLYNTNLHNADLRNANLDYANLRFTFLDSANLTCASLVFTNLHCADLRNANLSHTIFRCVNLEDADLRNAKNPPFVPYACPDTSSFIGYKEAQGYIVQLEILSDARRSSATSRECRCDKAKVLSIQNIDGTQADIKSIGSNYNDNFVYTVEEIVTEPNFCEDRWNECAAGIHFFTNRQEAVNYGG